jgi:hypothetical protein
VGVGIGRVGLQGGLVRAAGSDQIATPVGIEAVVDERR